MTGGLTREEVTGTKRRVKLEAEIGVMQLQAQERQAFTAVPRTWERGLKWILPPRLQKEHGPADALSLDL